MFTVILLVFTQISSNSINNIIIIIANIIIIINAMSTGDRNEYSHLQSVSDNR